MSAPGRPAFGRRAGSPPVRQAAAPPAQGPALSAQAEAFAQQVAAQAALTRGRDRGELKDWNSARRAQLWKAAGPWKYWAAVLGAVAFTLGLAGLGPTAVAAVTVLRGLGLACAIMAFWRARARADTA